MGLFDRDLIALDHCGRPQVFAYRGKNRDRLLATMRTGAGYDLRYASEAFNDNLIVRVSETSDVCDSDGASLLLVIHGWFLRAQVAVE